MAGQEKIKSIEAILSIYQLTIGSIISFKLVFARTNQYKTSIIIATSILQSNFFLVGLNLSGMKLSFILSLFFLIYFSEKDI